MRLLSEIQLADAAMRQHNYLQAHRYLGNAISRLVCTICRQPLAQGRPERIRTEVDKILRRGIYGCNPNYDIDRLVEQIMRAVQDPGVDQFYENEAHTDCIDTYGSRREYEVRHSDEPWAVREREGRGGHAS